MLGWGKGLFLIILLLLFLLIPLQLFLDRFNRGETYSPMSTYRADAYGTKAFYLFLDGMNLPITRRKISAEIRGSSKGTMIFAGPGLMSIRGLLKGSGSDATLKEEEVDSLLEWVAEGNQLWVLSPYGTLIHDKAGVKTKYDIAGLLGDAATLGDWIKLARKQNGKKTAADEEDDLSLFEKLFDQLSLPKQEREVAPELRDPNLSHVRTFAGPYLEAEKSDSQWLAGSREKPLAISQKHGRGHIVFIADFYMASNAGIDKAQNVEFLWKVLKLQHPEGGTVFFDEFHHGLRNDEGIVGLMAKHSLHFLLLQGLLLLGLCFWRFYPRDGEALEEDVEKVRNTKSYVASAAALYQNIIPASDVAASLYNAFWKKEMKRLHLPDKADSEQVREVLRERQPEKEAPMAEIQRTAQQMTKGKISHKQLMQFVSLLNLYERTNS